MTCQTYGGKYEHSASMLALAGFLTYIGAFQFAVGLLLICKLALSTGLGSPIAGSYKWHRTQGLQHY